MIGSIILSALWITVQQPVDESLLPREWVQLKDVPNKSAFFCSSYSDSRRVFLRGGRPWVTEIEEVGDRRDPLPFLLPEGRRSEGLGGDRLVYPFAGGWAVGFDAGEFGGGLWWFSGNGQQRWRLSEENVIGFVPSTRGLLVLDGISHLDLSHGRVLLLSASAEGPPTMRILAELPGAPYAFESLHPDTVIVGTPGGVSRVEASGKIIPLSQSKVLPHPNSLVVGPSGIIYVGMMHFVLMLTPHEGAYRETWLGPRDCPNLDDPGKKHIGKCQCIK